MASRPLAGLSSTSENLLDRFSTDERATAARLGGHVWNIINNQKEHYLVDARCKDHYIDEAGRTTGKWFNRKNLGSGTTGTQGSKLVSESFRCPPSSGKSAQATRLRETRQLCQLSAPMDYGKFRASMSQAVPGQATEVPMPGMTVSSGSFRERPRASTQNLVDRASWMPRRGEAPKTERPPPDTVLYSQADQLRAESRMNVADPRFAATLHSGTRSFGGSATISAPPSSRSGSSRRTQSVAPFQSHSSRRLDDFAVREISDWQGVGRDKLKRGDTYHMKPFQSTGSSSVKYDIISSDKKQFWY